MVCEDTREQRLGHRQREVYEDMEYQNEVEGRAMYDLLEKEIVPLFYDRGSMASPGAGQPA